MWAPLSRHPYCAKHPARPKGEKPTSAACPSKGISQAHPALHKGVENGLAQLGHRREHCFVALIALSARLGVDLVAQGQLHEM
jgi:hypothetical protein